MGGAHYVKHVSPARTMFGNPRNLWPAELRQPCAGGVGASGLSRPLPFPRFALGTPAGSGPASSSRLHPPSVRPEARPGDRAPDSASGPCFGCNSFGRGPGSADCSEEGGKETRPAVSMQKCPSTPSALGCPSLACPPGRPVRRARLLAAPASAASEAAVPLGWWRRQGAVSCCREAPASSARDTFLCPLRARGEPLPLARERGRAEQASQAEDVNPEQPRACRGSGQCLLQSPVVSHREAGRAWQGCADVPGPVQTGLP